MFCEIVVQYELISMKIPEFQQFLREKSNPLDYHISSVFQKTVFEKFEARFKILDVREIRCNLELEKT